MSVFITIGIDTLGEKFSDCWINSLARAMFAQAGEAVLLSRKFVDSSLAMKLDVALFSVSLSTSEPVCTEESVLAGECGTSDKEILHPVPLLSMGLLIKILEDTVM